MVWVCSSDHRGGAGRVGAPSGRFGTGRGNHPEVRDGSGDPWGGPGRVGGPFWKSVTGRETQPEVRDR